MSQHWSVAVSMNGETLVTIESNCLSGKSEFTDEEAQVIRDAAAHLKAFIGDPHTEKAGEGMSDEPIGVAAVEQLYGAPCPECVTLRARLATAEAAYQEAQLTIAGLEAEVTHHRTEAARLREQVEGKYAEGYAAAVEDHL